MVAREPALESSSTDMALRLRVSPEPGAGLLATDMAYGREVGGERWPSSVERVRSTTDSAAVLLYLVEAVVAVLDEAALGELSVSAPSFLGLGATGGGTFFTAMGGFFALITGRRPPKVTVLARSRNSSCVGAGADTGVLTKLEPATNWRISRKRALSSALSKIYAERGVSNVYVGEDRDDHKNNAGRK
jgi:hypothetical protein